MQARIKGNCAQFGFEYKNATIVSTFNTGTGAYRVEVYPQGFTSQSFMLESIPLAMQFIDSIDSNDE